MDFIYDLSLWEWFFFLFFGITTGIINTLAGSGSVVTLPIFMFICGLNPMVANATNRLGIVVQSLVGVRGFQKKKITDFKQAPYLLIPAVIGGIIGIFLALNTSQENMKNSIGYLLIFMLVLLLFQPKKWLNSGGITIRNKTKWYTYFIYFIIGLYGGYLQAGVGVILLAALVLVNHFKLLVANGLKMLFILVFNIPALLIFTYHNQIHFGFGATMALYQGIGAFLAVKYATKIPNINLYIHRLLVTMILIAIGKFFFSEWILDLFK